jgi:uncharacterized protein
MITEPSEVAAAKRRPTEYFRDHISVTFWFESVAAQKLIPDIGIDNVLLETDIPHPTCLYPDPMRHFSRVLSGLEPHVLRRVVQDNAVELYRIALPEPA